jgi:pimeloyl-ACP methyl ester carboxylesterase
MPKKVTFKNAKNLKLVGLLYSGSPDTLVIMAHGSGSNRFAKGMFEKVAGILHEAGYSVLTFDFSGHGQSDDTVIALENPSQDLQAAFDFAKQLGYQNFALVGHSLGAYGALKAFEPRVKTIVLLGALTGPVHWKWEAQCSLQQLDEMRTKGYITFFVNDGLRASLQIDAHLLKDIQAINQKELLEPINCKVLMIHGQKDQQELDLLPFSKRALDFLPQGSELKVIEQASHSFVEHAEEVGKLAKKWLLSHCPL